LAGIRFIWSRKFEHKLISVWNIRLSQGRNVKPGKKRIIKQPYKLIMCVQIPLSNQQIESKFQLDTNSLGTLMLELMNEMRQQMDAVAGNTVPLPSDERISGDGDTYDDSFQ
jgi:hypothetical protein